MTHTVNITALAYGGAGVGKIDGKVVFVPYTAPGDEVAVEVTSEKKGYSEASLVEILKPSVSRREPPCKVFGRCGGCQWQHINYTEQLEWKHRIFEETLKRIGKIQMPALDPPVGSPLKFNYRSRARFHVAKSAWGFFGAKSHRVVDIEGCPLIDPLVNDTFRALKAILSRVDTGLHTVEIGIDRTTKTAVCSLHVRRLTGFDWHGALKEVPLVKGFEVWIKDPAGRGKGKRVVKEGERRVFYTVGQHPPLTIGADISVFSQTNALQNEKLVERVVEMAEGGEGAGTELKGCTVADLFCGAGNLTLPLSKRALKTIGVDLHAEAIKNARENAELNNSGDGPGSLGFFHESAAAGKTLESSKPHVVVLDPPRAGGMEVMKTLARLGPQKIIYVSCSPPTLARDAAFLAQNGYSPFRAGVIDMFPQTFHIEGVIGLKKGT